MPTRDSTTLFCTSARCGRTPFGIVALVLAVALAGCSASSAEVKERKEQADYHHQLANGYFHSGNIELAVPELIKALELDENHADSHYLYGFILFGRKRYEEAIGHFRKALTAKPEFFAARNHMGVTYLEMERWADAIVTLEPLLKEPTYTTLYLVYNNLGWAYLKQHDLRLAEKNLRMSVFLNPKFCNGYRNLGLLAMEREDTAAAVEQLTEACNRCPLYAELQLQRAEALMAAGDGPGAQAALAKCVELSGDTPLGRRCRSKM